MAGHRRWFHGRERYYCGQCWSQQKAKAYLTVDSAYFELDAEVLVEQSRAMQDEIAFL